MTYREWEESLKYILRDLQSNEVIKILEYYKEIYGDKIEAEFSDEEIIAEFGTPEECAEKIKSENDDLPKANIEKKTEKPEKEKKSLQISAIIGYICLAVFVLIPLVAIILGAIAALGAVTVGGFAAAVGGAFGIFWSIVQLISGVGFVESLALFGMSVCLIGAGLILGVIFLILTKYAVIATYKASVFCYKKIRGE